MKVAIPDLISPSYFPAIAAVEMGFFKQEGIDATLELLYPVTKTYEDLRDGKLDFVGGASHAVLYAFKDWQGAKLLCGGARLTGKGPNGEDLSKGWFCEPTVFDGVTENMRIANEEIFGPVLAVMRAKDFDDAMRIANNIPLGLSASIQTTNVSRVFDFVYKMEAGLLTVNLPSAGVEYQLPFGGTKDSSFGPKEQGPAS